MDSIVREIAIDGYDEIDPAYLPRMSRSLGRFGDGSVQKRLMNVVSDVFSDGPGASMSAKIRASKKKGKKGGGGGDGGGHGHSHDGGGGHGHSHDGGSCGGGHPPDPVDENAVREDMLEEYCAGGRFSKVVLLHLQGVDVARRKVVSGTNATTLMWAANNGHLEICRFLVDNGVGVNTAADDGHTPLSWAVTDTRYDVADFLLSKGADPLLKDSNGFNSYFMAIQQESFAMLLLLHKYHPIDITMVDSTNHSLMMWAAYRGSTTILEWLHQTLGGDLTLRDVTRRTCVHWAAREGHIEALGYCLQNGLSASDVDEQSMNALQHAEARKHKATVNFLRKKGATVPPSPASGTLKFMAESNLHFAMVMFGAILATSAYFASHFVPPIVATFFIGFVLGKNVIINYFVPRPQRTNDPAISLAMEIGAPKTFAGGIRGNGYFRHRELAVVSGFWLSIVFVLMNIKWVSTEGALVKLVPEGNAADIPQIPVVALGCLALAVLLGLITKFKSFKSMIQPRLLADSPVFRIVDDRAFHHLEGRVADAEANLRIPARAGYCFELGRYFKKYDSWSLILDCPIAANNHTEFVLTIMCLCGFFLGTLLQYGPFFWYSMCPPVPEGGGGFCDFHPFSMALFFMPCTVKHVGEPISILPQFAASFYHAHIMPTAAHVAVGWLAMMPATMLLVILSVLYNQISHIARGITRNESKFPVVLADNDKLTSIVRPSAHGPGHSIYSRGAANNLISFFTFQPPVCADGVYEVAAPLK